MENWVGRKGCATGILKGSTKNTKKYLKNSAGGMDEGSFS